MIKNSLSSMQVLLLGELEKRCQANPRYSLRSFARYLGIEASHLSKILRGQRSVTERMLLRVAPKLGMSPKDLDHYREVIRKQERRLGNSATALPNYNPVEMDQFQIISDWYHFAILELVSMEGFVASPQWISRVLGINVNEASAAIDRLFRLGYLETQPDGSWKNRSGFNTTIGNDFTTAALRQMQRQILQMAIDALEAVPFDQRSQSAMTMAVDKDLLPRLKERITQFRRETDAFIQKNSKKLDSVYHLSVSLYPVTKELERN